VKPLLEWLTDWAVVLLLPVTGTVLSLAVFLIERRMKKRSGGKNSGQAE